MRQTDNATATLLMVGAMAAFAVEDLFLKRAAMALPPGQVIAMMGAGIDVEATPAEYFSDVSVSNLPSLRAHRSLGFERFATVRCLRLGARWLWRSAPPAGLPTPTGLRVEASRLVLSREELAWHRAAYALARIGFAR